MTLLLNIGGGVTIDADRQLMELDRADYEDSLYLFLKAAWPNITSAEFVDGWAMQAIAEHLEAVIDGQIKRLMIHVPPRTGKPVDGSALVLTEHRGLIPLREIKPGDRVWTHRGRWQRVWEVHAQGVIPVLKVITRHGRTVRAAPDHPFLTTDGWRNLGDIRPDDVLGLAPMYCGSGGTKTISNEAARLLGYLVGDGTCKGTPHITVADDIEATDIEAAAAACGFSTLTRAYKATAAGYWVRRISLKRADGEVHTRKRKEYGPVRNWLLEHGLRDQTSYTKMIPKAVLEGDADIVRNFIGAYWACDGYISTKGPKRDGTARDDLVIGCDSVNQAFLLQLQTLLLRLGIDSNIRKKVSKIKTARQGDTYTSYSMTICGQDNCWRFAQQIDIRHSKYARIEQARRHRFDFDHTLIGDVVESIEPDGEAECFCLTVDRDQSFVANGFAVHNTNLCSIALPAWTWAQRHKSPTSGPGVRFMYASYGEGLSMDHSVYCRRLIKSDWYQEHWGDRFKLMADQDTKHKFSNNKGGERQITSIDARVTGRGGDVILIDDPNATNEAFSDAKIHAVNTWWNETMLSRLNNRRDGAFVVIQQRVAENDLSGHILETTGEKWDHLMLPMRFEKDRVSSTSIGWTDPRTEEGELLWPERFSEGDVRSIERESTQFVFAGQYQQRPEPKGGGVIKRDWWLNWEEEAFPPMDYILASLDTAYTEKQENDPSALTIWGVFSQDNVATPSRVVGLDGRPINHDRTYGERAPRLMLMYGWRERLEFHELVKKTAESMKKFKCDLLLVENKAAGHSVAQEIRRLYSHENWAVKLHDPKSSDKLARLYSVQHIWEEGMVYAPDRSWSDLVITEVSQFNKGRYDDLTDTCSQAVRYLRDIGLLQRAPERQAEIEQEKHLYKDPPPLYPV